MHATARRLTLLLLLIGAVSACSRSVRAPRDSQTIETTLRVENRSFADVNIFVIRSGQRIRLGTVTGLSTRVLVIPRGVMSGPTPLQFLADPIGSNRTPISQEITVQPGDEVGLVIPP